LSDIDSKRRKFEKQLDEIAKGYQQAAISDQQSAGSDQPLAVEQRMQEWEALLKRRLAEHRAAGQAEPTPAPAETAAPAEAPPPIPPVFPRPGRPFAWSDGALHAWLADLDGVMLNELALNRFPTPGGFSQPVRIVESDQDMRQAIAQACGYGGDPAGMPIDEHCLGVFHHPGGGTLLNRQHYARHHGLLEFDQGDLQPRAELISEVARERWGWGYLLEYTSLGQEAGQAGLWPAMVASRLGLQVGDGRNASLAATLRRAWILTEAGWLDWVWQYVMFKARNPVGERLFARPRPGRMLELLVKILDLFPLYLAPLGVRIRLRNLFDLFKFLFLEEGDIVPATLNSVLLYLQKFCSEHDQQVENKIGQPLSQVLGRIYFADLEGHVGILSTPYAVLIATHLPELALAEAQDGMQLDARIAENPRLNPDTRLAMLSKLDARVKYDPQAMFTAAWERLQLEGPR